MNERNVPTSASLKQLKQNLYFQVDLSHWKQWIKVPQNIVFVFFFVIERKMNYFIIIFFQQRFFFWLHSIQILFVDVAHVPIIIVLLILIDLMNDDDDDVLQ